MRAPIRTAARRAALAPEPTISTAIPQPTRWPDLRRAAEQRARSATGNQPAIRVTFAPGSGWIRA